MEGVVSPANNPTEGDVVSAPRATRVVGGGEYSTGAELLAGLCDRFPVEGVSGHSDIAPGRKTDPGPFFSWGRLRRELAVLGRADLVGRIEPAGAADDDDRTAMRWPFPVAARPG